jgi:hypothetical protein
MRRRKSLRRWSLPEGSGQWDRGVVASFGYFLPPAIIRALPSGVVNMHPSLLPRVRPCSRVGVGVGVGVWVCVCV